MQTMQTMRPDSRLMRRVCDENWISVRPSDVHGDGVFANVHLRPGLRLAYYRGEIMSKADFDARYANTTAHYGLCIPKDRVIDGVNPKLSNWTRYINDPYGTTRQPNCIYTVNAIVQTTRPIEPNEELLMDYGSGYFKTH